MTKISAAKPVKVALQSARLSAKRSPATGEAHEIEAREIQAIAPAPIGPDRIVLAGFMGSGKTAAGGLLAERLGWRFLDLDREIERRDGRSVPAIFSESGDRGGETYFRRLESAALTELLREHRTVLALGGGAPESAGNRLLLEQTPRTAVVYLHAPLATLLERCRKDAARPDRVHRPLLIQAEGRFQIRHPIYERMATHRIDTAALDIEQTVSAILKALAGR